MHAHVLRLLPGDDLRRALDAAFRTLNASSGLAAACVVSGIGSLTQAQLRYADAAEGSLISGPLEMLSLAGTLGLDGPHLHAAVSDAQGRVHGGHVLAGCIVRTTAEIVLALLPEWEFRREPDAATGYLELAPKPRV
jgi:predicted DNA-binding protein with PD1-like motif